MPPDAGENETSAGWVDSQSRHRRRHRCGWMTGKTAAVDDASAEKCAPGRYLFRHSPTW